MLQASVRYKDVCSIKTRGEPRRLFNVSFVNIAFYRKCPQPEHSTSLQAGVEAGVQTASHLASGDDDDFICDRIKTNLLTNSSGMGRGLHPPLPPPLHTAPLGSQLRAKVIIFPNLTILKRELLRILDVCKLL